MCTYIHRRNFHTERCRWGRMAMTLMIKEVKECSQRKCRGKGRYFHCNQWVSWATLLPELPWLGWATTRRLKNLDNLSGGHFEKSTKNTFLMAGLLGAFFSVVSGVRWTTKMLQSVCLQFCPGRSVNWLDYWNTATIETASKHKATAVEIFTERPHLWRFKTDHWIVGVFRNTGRSYLNQKDLSFWY